MTPSLCLDVQAPLNYFERRNSPYFSVISSNSMALRADYVTMVELRPTMSAKYRLPVTFGQKTDLHSSGTVSLRQLSFL